MSSKIRWTNNTWNPVTGCSKVSPGCQNCFAEHLSNKQYKIAIADGKTPEQIHHAGWTEKPWTAPNAAENVILHPDRLSIPLSWRKPRMVFVNSMSDLFHEQVPDGYIFQVWEIMRVAQQHTFQILTKRPDRMEQWVKDWVKYSIASRQEGQPLPNVWLGTSIEDQRRANERTLHLLQTPAAIRFLSCEPLLEEIDITRFLTIHECADCGWTCHHHERPLDRKRNRVCPDCKSPYCADHEPHEASSLKWGPNGVEITGSIRGIDWVIVGGESGPGFRKMDLDWARRLRDQCVDAGVCFFFKQMSAYRSETGQLLDGVRHEQYPEGGPHA